MLRGMLLRSVVHMKFRPQNTVTQLLSVGVHLNTQTSVLGLVYKNRRLLKLPLLEIPKLP